jgi:Raf kinase inhibitor-like YbhB/YbcL family protein
MKYNSKEADYKLLEITSPAFADQEFIPVQYTCDGINVNPPLKIGHIPDEAKSLAIIVEDPDAPSKTWIHWLVWNIPTRHEIHENELPGVQGINDFNLHQYGGPCPPSGIHRYFFKVYALDAILELPEHTKVAQLEKAMSAHILSFGQLMGKYKRAGSKK